MKGNKFLKVWGTYLVFDVGLTCIPIPFVLVDAGEVMY